MFRVMSLLIVRISLTVVAGLLASQTTANAAAVTVVNSGFEDISGETQQNGFTFGAFNGWSVYDPNGIAGAGRGGTYFLGTLMPTPPNSFFAGAPEGDRVALAFNFSGSGGGGEYGLQQTLAETLQANHRYTLDVEIGNIAAGFAQNGTFFDLNGFPGYRVDLLAGGVLLAQDDNLLGGMIAEGVFETSTISFTSGAIHSQLGQALQIRLVNLNVIDAGFPTADLEVDFDDVRLNASAVPEPSGVFVVLIGMLAVLPRLRSQLNTNHRRSESSTIVC